MVRNLNRVQQGVCTKLWADAGTHLRVSAWEAHSVKLGANFDVLEEDGSA